VLPAFVGLISKIDRSLGHGAALVKAILWKRPEQTCSKKLTEAELFWRL
jgi:hypothetical protein